MKTANLVQLCIVASLTSFLQAKAQGWSGVQIPRCVARVVKAEHYSSWIKPYTKHLRKGGPSNKHEIKLSLTVLDGDDLGPDASSGIRFGGNDRCQMTTTYLLSSGMVSMTRVTLMAVQRGGPDRLPIEMLTTIQKLVPDLLRRPPDDHAIVPPQGRRLVLHVEDRSKVLARVYDRADLPPQVQEVLSLIGATSGPIWMEFRSSAKTLQELGEPPIPVDAVGDRSLHHRDSVTNGPQPDTAALAVSPNNSMIVTHYFLINARTVVTDRSGGRVLLAVSDYTADLRWIYISHAFFTPDSRYLLLLSNLPAIYVYDTNTWKSVDRFPGLPEGAIAFYPASDWKHGVAVLRGGHIESWDVSRGQKQTDLDLQGDLRDVSFSEDGSLFAVSTVRLNPDSSSTFRLRVWDTNTGRFLREMVPPYYFEQDEMSKPMWWGHGTYLLADIRAGHWDGYMVAIWNVQSGQLRGGFPGCDHSEDPYAVGIDGNRLKKRCRDGTLMVWDIPSAVEKIAEFEQSLRRSSKPLLPDSNDLIRQLPTTTKSRSRWTRFLL